MLRRYGIATGATLVLLALRILLEPVIGGSIPFLFAFPAVMLSALWGGFGPALLSTAINVVVLGGFAWWNHRLGSTGMIAGLLVFTASGFVAGMVSERLERARERAAEAALSELRAQRAATALQERLRLIIDSVPALISYIDSDLRYQMVNRGYERWFERAPGKVEGRHVREVLGPAAWERVRPYMERALRGENVRYEDALPYEHGGTRWVEVIYTPDRDREGEVLGFVVLVHDISERKRAELALVDSVEQSERKRALVTALSETLTPMEVARAVIEHVLPMTGACAGGVVTVSEDGTSLETLTSEGYRADVIEPWMRFSIDAPVPVADAARTGKGVFLRSAEERLALYPEMAESLPRQRTGASASVPMVMLGRTIGVLALTWESARDISEEERSLLHGVAGHCAHALERARLYQAEQRAREQAEDANRAKDEFLAMLGHELRNPLAPIVTAVELMKLRGDGTSARERVVIERQAHHLVQLVDDLLDVSRIARGKLQLKRAPVEVHEAIARAIEIASPLLEQRQHRLDVDVPSAGLRISGDATRLAQIFANLLTNAAKYTDPGGAITVSASQEAGQVVVRVRDTGVGIPPDLLPHVFDLFVQGPRGVDRSKGGLGLGLTIVKSLVGLHDGSVSARSEGRGRGTEIEVRLPMLEPQTAAAGEPAARAPSGTRRRAERVLVVDDNVDAAEMLGELLAREGHEARIAHDGPSALAMLPEFRPDVAVLDLGLPVMDGYELAQKIREAAGSAPPRLVALTGYGQPSDRERTRAAGFAVHLVKPVDLGELLRAIDPSRAEAPQSASSKQTG